MAMNFVFSLKEKEKRGVRGFGRSGKKKKHFEIYKSFPFLSNFGLDTAWMRELR